MLQSTALSKDDKRRLRGSATNGLWSKRDVAEYLNVAPWTVDQKLRKLPDFPRPRWLTDTTPRWLPEEIKAWVASRPTDDVAPSWKPQPAKRRRRPMPNNVTVSRAE